MQAGQGSKLQWERIRERFHHAVELEPAERELYLQSACGDDVLLRGEIRALLVEHDNATGLLATGPSDFQPHPTRFLLSPGDCLAGRFEIIRPLGAGGMGEVYEAHDRELGARVALKTLRPELVHDPKNCERFKHEILNGRKVTHPNICRIYDLAPDYSQEGTFLAFTMELLGGETLGAYLEQQPGNRLPVEEALPLVRQMAAGLDALHAEDIIHRDFKPGNVILVRQGDSTLVRITDFGLARSTEASGQTLSGSKDIVGTPIYMAPEQLMGERAKVSPATDVYALGLVLYEMVTGTRAYPAETLSENILQKTQGPPAPPRERFPGLDEKWNTTIQRCLEQEPGDRPGSPSEVVAALEGEVTLPRLKGARSRKRTHDRAWADPRLRWGAAAAVVIFLALAALSLRLPIVEDAQPVNVAVLPFTAIGGDPELQVFADGLMETVARRLSQFERLNEKLLVVPVSELRQRTVKTPTDALNRFGVDYAVEGGLQRQGDRLRLVLTLIDTRRVRQLGTTTVDGAATQGFTLEQGAVTKLANLLGLRILPEHVAAEVGLGPVVPSAYEFYSRGRGYLLESHKTENLENAIAMFQRALEDDDQYALAHAGLGEAYWRKYERTSNPEWVGRAVGSCQKAIKSNDQLVEVHVTLGIVNSGTGNYEEAVENFETALDLDPRNAAAFGGLARVYAQTDRLDEARATYLKAMELRPGDWRMYHQLGTFYFGQRDYAAAIEPFRRVIDLTPGSAQGHLNLGAALHGSGKLEEARAEYERSIEIEPRPLALSNLAKLLKESGQYAEAARLREQAIEMNEHSFELWGDLAGIYERLGDDRATETYRRAAELAIQALRVNPERRELYSDIAHYSAGANRLAEARQWLGRAAGRLDTASAVEAVVNAATFAKLGERKQCLLWLEAGIGTQKGEETALSSSWLNEFLATDHLKEIIREHKANMPKGAQGR